MWKFIRTIIVLILISGLIFSGVIVYRGYDLYKSTMENVDIHEVFESYQIAPSYVSIDEIPSKFLDAIIAVEDHRFMEHGGFDIVSFGRAVLRNVLESEYAAGGSTITQQLSKNLFFSFDKTLDRKVAELIVAKQLESSFKKTEILEMYVNIIYFGDGFEGIFNAAQGYFGKHPSELTDAECIIIAGLPQAPSAYALKDHMDKAIIRSDAVMDAMIEHGYLLASEKELIKKEIKTIKIQVN